MTYRIATISTVKYYWSYRDGMIWPGVFGWSWKFDSTKRHAYELSIDAGQYYYMNYEVINSAAPNMLSSNQQMNQVALHSSES
jgi:hypothetical protein